MVEVSTKVYNHYFVLKWLCWFNLQLIDVATEIVLHRHMSLTVLFFVFATNKT